MTQGCLSYVNVMVLSNSLIAKEVRVRTADGSLDTYQITKFHGSNAGMCYNQRPIVAQGDKVVKGES